MKNYYLSILLSLFILCSFGFAKVGIVINKDLYSKISVSVDQYVQNLEIIENKTVWINSTDFNELNTTMQLRDTLKKHYQTDSLEGVVFIGDLPICIYEIEDDYPQWNHGYKRWPTDLYYMDLDGIWEDNILNV